MKVIVVGCGRVGSQLAGRLFQQGHQVTVLDAVASAFDNLDPEFRGRTLEGDVLAQDTLRRAGIETADGLAAVTSSDTLNCVICHVARTVYHIANVVARNYEPRVVALYEAFGVQAVGASAWGAQRIEEMLADTSLRTVYSAGNGEVEIYEVMVPEGWQGRRLGEMVSYGGCLPVALTRAGKSVLPKDDMPLQVGDILNLSATFAGIEALRGKLANTKGA
jgi:trk system potassium uptake protein TrkA